MVTGLKISIIESDVPFSSLLGRELERKGLQVEVRRDASNISEHLHTSKTDLLIIDLNLPSANGMQVVKNIRATFHELPILVLSESNRVEDLEQAFEHGADDLVAKPVSLREFVARSRRLLRRNGSPADNLPKSCKLIINREGLAVLRDGRQIDLTPKEFAILDYLIQNSGKVVSRQDLMEEFWKVTPTGSTNVIDVYMKYLRDKIDGGQENKIIRTVRGLGYVLKGGEYQYA